jgi:hypothetical protein
MKTVTLAVGTIAAALTAAFFVAPLCAEEPKTNDASASPAAGQPSPEMMKQMMELAKLNENHKLLASSDGTWSYTVKMWMNGDPSSKPDISKGVAIRRSIMGGRYVVMEVRGKMDMPGPDGKMMTTEFQGRGTEGYDNVKKKFVSTWMDNMGTGIMMSEGTYDDASKSFTYNGEYEAMPGMKMKAREVVKMNDKDHMTLEWFETRGAQEVKTMEIDYTRRK